MLVFKNRVFQITNPHSSFSLPGEKFNLRRYLARARHRHTRRLVDALWIAGAYLHNMADLCILGDYIYAWQYGWIVDFGLCIGLGVTADAPGPIRAAAHCSVPPLPF